MKKPAILKQILPTVILCGTLFWAASLAQATVADGVWAYEKGNYEQARMEWLPYAALGNPNALYNLGQLSRMGRGIEQNYTKAEEYYQRAAEKGHVGAQRNLGTLYYFGRLGESDLVKAQKWLLKAAINGDNRSQLMTGTMYYNGEAGEKDILKAYAWIMLAAQEGLGNAARALDKLNAVMTEQQINQAKELVPAMISRQLSPDDVGLMVKQQDNNSQNMAELKTPKPEKSEKAEKTIQAPQEDNSTVPASPLGIADNFRVQLGSFRSEETARKAMNQMGNRLSPLLDDVNSKIEFADLGEKGIYYRLQIRPFENTFDAEQLCSQLKENGQGCYVVKVP